MFSSLISSFFISEITLLLKYESMKFSLNYGIIDNPQEYRKTHPRHLYSVKRTYTFTPPIPLCTINLSDLEFPELDLFRENIGEDCTPMTFQESKGKESVRPRISFNGREFIIETGESYCPILTPTDISLNKNTREEGYNLFLEFTLFGMCALSNEYSEPDGKSIKIKETMFSKKVLKEREDL